MHGDEPPETTAAWQWPRSDYGDPDSLFSQPLGLTGRHAEAAEAYMHAYAPTCPPIQLPAEQPRIWLHRSQGPGGLALQYLCLVAHAETSLDDRHVQGSQLNQRLQRHFPHGRLSRAVWWP